MNIVVASHGRLAEGFLDAFHMMAGDSCPIVGVGLDDAGVDDFRERLTYEVKRALSSSGKVLIMSDLFGGTPYNESYALFLQHPDDVRVVAGTNFPMLIEVGIAAAGCEDLGELVRVALEAGRAGVRTCDDEEEAGTTADKKGTATAAPETPPAAPTPAPAPAPTAPSSHEPLSNHSVVLARVDDRVIHGQTTTRWMAVRPVDSILVISDKIAADKLRCKVLKAAAGSLKLGIYTLAQGPAALERARASQKRFFVISDSIGNFAKLLELGGDFGPALNIGNLNATREGTKNLGDTMMLTNDDARALDELQAAGVDLQFQLLPDRDIRTWPALKAKFESL